MTSDIRHLSLNFLRILGQFSDKDLLDALQFPDSVIAEIGKSDPLGVTAVYLCAKICELKLTTSISIAIKAKGRRADFIFEAQPGGKLPRDERSQQLVSEIDDEAKRLLRILMIVDPDTEITIKGYIGKTVVYEHISY